MIEAIFATYNESETVEDHIRYFDGHVDRINICDDDSTDGTVEKILSITPTVKTPTWVKKIPHTGLPETVKREALSMCNRRSWILMLDCDEKFEPGAIEKITTWIKSSESDNFTHIWFGLDEYIDGYPTRSFLKCRAFRAEAVKFSDEVHRDDEFRGNGINLGLKVLHVKSAEKQIKREHEYLETYKRLVEEGKITQERANEMKGFHYFIHE